MKIGLRCNYIVSSWDVIELPDGKTWDDVESIWVKWGVVYYQIKGEEQDRQVGLSDASLESCEFKYPDTFQIEDVDEDGYPTGNVKALGNRQLHFIY